MVAASFRIRRTNSLGAACAVLIGCMAMVLGGCMRDSQGGVSPEDVAAMPDQESWNAVLRVSTDGRPSLVMMAPYMARYDSRDSTYAVLRSDGMGADSTLVRVELFEEGEPSAVVSAREIVYFDEERRFSAHDGVEALLLRAGEARLTAESLEFSEQDGRFTATGDVVVESQDGKRLETDRVVWDAEAAELRADGAFRFVTPTERITGVGLVASEDLSRYSFSNASGELEVEE